MKMKNIFLMLWLVALVFASCEDKTSEGVSKVTTFPTITINGEQTMFVLKNSTYTDAGAVAYAGEEELPVKTTGSVNTQTPGPYYIVYSATNAEGYPGAATRNVFVVSSLPTVDYSGEYQIVSTTRTTKSTITKNNDLLGYYHASDTWYQANKIPIDFFDNGDGTLTVIPGSSPYGAHTGTGKFLPDNQVQFTITLLNQGPLTYTTTWKLIK